MKKSRTLYNNNNNSSSTLPNPCPYFPSLDAKCQLFPHMLH
jgi:hypothetical protein